MTWSIDNVTKGGSNLLSHITEAHIYPNNFEAMNVKRTFQLFSHTFAAAIKTPGHEKELNTETWEATADFAERINNVIDACNSYSVKVTYGGKRPLSPKNPDLKILLTNFTEWCSKWSKSAQEVTQVPCFKGFVLTTRAILATYALMKDLQIDLKELNLQQDCVIKIRWSIYSQNLDNAEGLILIQLQEWYDYPLDIYFQQDISKRVTKVTLNVEKVRLL